VQLATEAAAAVGRTAEGGVAVAGIAAATRAAAARVAEEKGEACPWEPVAGPMVAGAKEATAAAA